jgi:uncharacterized RDD family membrane protein YckC
MSSAAAQNRFAPPRAEVEDQHAGDAVMVDAGRWTRLLAALIDGVIPAIIGAVIGFAVAFPAYQRYQQEHVSGIAPPALGSSHHMTTTWAWLGGLVLLGYCVYSLVLVYLYGQTLGKRTMDIRVVRTDGSRVGLARVVFLRWLAVGLIGGMIGSFTSALHLPNIGFLISLIDCLMIFGAARLCLHDRIADTRVVGAAASAHATLRGDPKYAGANLRTINF